MSKYKTPEEIYGNLFYDIHRSEILEDGKSFADARALVLPNLIIEKYNNLKEKPDFDLLQFIEEYFILPKENQSLFQSDPNEILTVHVNKLWSHLERSADQKTNRTSIIPLPESYIVPGGRFNEIYYWDSYFTMLGLATSDRWDLIKSMINNFKHLIHDIGHIPNGNRTYFLSRSQPPFYSLMVKLLIQKEGNHIIKDYIDSLVIEYNFWMNGITMTNEKSKVAKHVVRLDKNILLNRYFDQKDTPREEMYSDDWKMIVFDKNTSHPLFGHIRAACESGWDFSCRWFAEINDLHSIMTLDLLPIDLNCLLWHLEKLISECYHQLEKEELSIQYAILANQRKKNILKYFWNAEIGFYNDINFKTKKGTKRLTLAGMYPLFFGLATEEQAKISKQTIIDHFLKPGGLVSTPYNSGQQWDAPNGWAPLQWISIQGLLKYGFKPLAQEIASRWTHLNEEVFRRTGKMLEKYNVVNTNLEGGGGEYPVQDGFGWTNGVYLALKKS